jgi:hypothetical protein
MKRNPRPSDGKSKVDDRPISVAPAQIELLTEIAALLLDHGITPAQLHALMERPFALAAAKNARLKNGRANYSRIAAKTGLRRVEVRHLLRTGATTLLPPNPLDRLVRGWRTDKDFRDRSGQPRPLTVDGKEGSFARLAQRYASDLPKRALIQELLDSGLASSRGKALRLHRPKEGRGFLGSKLFRASAREILRYAREGKQCISAAHAKKKLTPR